MGQYRTLAVRPETFDRFEAYKFASMTADDVLNWLMERVPLEQAIDEFARARLGKAAAKRTRGRRR